MILPLFTSTVIIDPPNTWDLAKSISNTAIPVFGLFLRLIWDFLKGMPLWLWGLIILFVALKIFIKRKENEAIKEQNKITIEIKVKNEPEQKDDTMGKL